MEYSGNTGVVYHSIDRAQRSLETCKNTEINIPGDFEAAGEIRGALDELKSVSLGEVKGEFSEAEGAFENADRHTGNLTNEFSELLNSLGGFGKSNRASGSNRAAKEIRKDKDKNTKSNTKLNNIKEWFTNKINGAKKTGAEIFEDTVTSICNFSWTDTNERAKLDPQADRLLNKNMNNIKNKQNKDEKELDALPLLGTIRRHTSGKSLHELNKRTQLSEEDKEYMNSQIRAYQELKEKEMEETTLATAESDALNLRMALFQEGLATTNYIKEKARYGMLLTCAQTADGCMNFFVASSANEDPNYWEDLKASGVPEEYIKKEKEKTKKFREEHIEPLVYSRAKNSFSNKLEKSSYNPDRNYYKLLERINKKYKTNYNGEAHKIFGKIMGNISQMARRGYTNSSGISFSSSWDSYACFKERC